MCCNHMETDARLYSLTLYAQSLSKSTDKMPKLRKFLRDHPGPTLIYVTLQKVSQTL